MGQLLGVKLAANEFVGYTQLASLMDVTNAIHFKYQKSVLMATFMLCGFANVASIGIQVGGIGIIAPEKKKILTELGFKAMIAGAIVSLMSATIAGMILGWSIVFLKNKLDYTILSFFQVLFKKYKEIIEIDRRSNRAKVKGINLVKKHIKTTKEKKGSITSKENFLDISNLAIIMDQKKNKKKEVKK